MNRTTPLKCIIKGIRQLSADTTLYTICTDAGYPVATSFQPGQFVQFSLPGVGEFPVSYCGSPSADGTIELCIRHIGHVTKALASVTPGQAAAVRGPFGKGFPLSEYAGRDLLLIAGGVGMAPLRSLLLALMKRRDDYKSVQLIYGCREPAAQLFTDELLQLQARGELSLILAVDHTGHCLTGPPECRIALLPFLVDELVIDPRCTSAAICGPPVVFPMLVKTLRQKGLSPERIHLSLERRMQCGIGRCGHCAVGQMLCCVNGPVFSCAEIDATTGGVA